MSEKFNQPPSEIHFWRDIPGTVKTVLPKGLSVNLPLDDPIIPGDEYQVLSVISAGSGNYDGGRKSPNDLALIDLREAPRVDGRKIFRGQNFDPTIDYMLIDSNFELSPVFGFKGLRKGEAFVYGRCADPNNLRDPLSRFTQHPEISAKHFRIEVDTDGKISLTDLSKNGTTVSARQKLVVENEVPNNEARQKKETGNDHGAEADRTDRDKHDPPTWGWSDPERHAEILDRVSLSAQGVLRRAASLRRDKLGLDDAVNLSEEIAAVRRSEGEKRKAGYKRLIRKHHPDLHGGDEGAQEAAKLINSELG